MNQRPIGVFDSGLGGLTAVRQLRRIMPSENIIYFGDTARVPYGNRGRETLLKYARQDLRFLRSFDLKAVVVACGNRDAALLAQDLFMSRQLRIYTSPDITGVEIGAALKNVIALCAGCCDGMGCGDNTKAMLMTRGLTEIARLGVALGARKETFAGLAGVGDLIVTCTSMHSRNRRAGILIGQGRTAQQAMDELGGAVVEGYYAAASAKQMADKAGVEMPITAGAYEVLYREADPRDVLERLMARERRDELEEEQSWI